MNAQRDEFNGRFESFETARTFRRNKTIAVRTLFMTFPNTWIISDRLAAVGGKNGWRTRVSDCRVKHGMTIENRCRLEDGVTISEYRYVTSKEEAA
jgi:hypothetical protein